MSLCSFAASIVLATGGAVAPCESLRSARAVVACAVATHPELRAQTQALAALAGKHTAASVWLPAQPELALSMADRRLWQATAAGPTPVVNLYATLSQRIEIGGQRSLRMAVVDAETRAQIERVAFAELAVATQAASRYFSLAAARERALLAADFRRMAARLMELCAARRTQQLISEVDATLLFAEASRMRFDAEAAELAADTASAELRVYVPYEVDATLVDVSAFNAVLDAQTVRDRRGDLRALHAQAEAQRALARSLARDRVPTITLSAFLQADGFAERVLGGGVAFPLYLPSPIAPSKSGEIATAKAQAAVADANAARAERQIDAELRAALATLRARQAQAALPLDATATRRSLLAVADALAAGQLPMREGLYTARALIDALERAIMVRAAVLLARIELARAAALPLAEVLP